MSWGTEKRHDNRKNRELQIEPKLSDFESN
jgi:hypothetical protein